MRIVQGELRGRVISMPKDIRPVTDIVKKACFNVLRDIWSECVVLDLFSGTGALSFEALSAGARSAILVEKNRHRIEVIRKNVAALGLSVRVETHCRDALTFLQQLRLANRKVDMIFLDPPYYTELADKALQAITQYDILAPFGYIACFVYEKDTLAERYDGLSVVYEKFYGQTRFLVYNKIS